MTDQRIGVDLGGTKIEAVLLAPDGSVKQRLRRRTPASYEGTLEAIAGVIAQLDDAAGTRPPVGIGSPGAWVPSTGAMKNCNATWLNERSLLTDLERSLGGRVRLANDANCLALAEAVDGAGRNAAVVFGVILGTGVGGGLVVDGRLVVGANAVAGEWGHTPLPYFRTDPATTATEAALPDRPCYCGRVNCVETFLSGPGLAATHERLAGARCPANEVPPDAPAWRLYATMLARALAQIVNVVDPHVVVLGGGVSAKAGLIEEVQGQLGRYVFTDEGATRIVAAEHGTAGGVIGAARLWPQAARRACL